MALTTNTACDLRDAPGIHLPIDSRTLLRLRCEALFKTHNTALVRAVYSRLRSWEEATEIVQEAYARIFRLSDPPPINFLLSYMYKTAFNLAFDLRGRHAFRQKREELIYSEVYSDLERENPTPERLCLDDEIQACMREAIDKLPPKCHRAFTLVELDGHTVRETAAQMGASETAVYQLINRSYARLARLVLERGWRK